MAEKRKVGKVERRKGHMYYVDGDGVVWETPMAKPGSKGKKKEG